MSGAFETLIHPLAPEVFFDQFWESSFLHIERERPDYYSTVLDSDAIDSFFRRSDIRYPSVRIVKKGSELSVSDYTRSFVYGSYLVEDVIDCDKVLHLFAEGATIVLQLAQDSLRQLSLLVNELEASLGFRVQTNVYLTPHSSQGFTAHYDTHSVFVFQLKGTKYWNLYDTPLPLPLQDQRGTEAEKHNLTPNKTIALKAGDMLYIPRGLYHDAHTENEPSVHVTMGVFPHTWSDILKAAVDELATDVSFRRAPHPLMLGKSRRSDLQVYFTSLLESLAERVDVFETAQVLRLKDFSRQRFDNAGRIADILSLRDLTLESKVEVRDVQVKRVVSNGNLSLFLADKKIDLPSSLAESIDFVFSVKRFSVCELPSSIDDPGKLLLVRTLVEEGLLRLLSR